MVAGEVWSAILSFWDLSEFYTNMQNAQSPPDGGRDCIGDKCARHGHNNMWKAMDTHYPHASRISETQHDLHVTFFS